MKKRFLLTVTILLAAVSFTCVRSVSAEAAPETEKKLGVTLELTYMSKWLSKGIEAYGSEGALFKTIDIDLYGTGFGFQLTHRNATSSGYVDQQRFDYRPYFKGSLFNETPYLMRYNLSFEYESYTGLSPRKANTTYEWINSFSWPRLLPYGLVPTYIFHYEYPALSGQANRNNVGAVHRFLLGYNMDVSALQNPIKLTTEVAYYDGLANRVSDWAYFTAGISTKINITEDLSFIPALYQQLTMDKNISKHKNITYCKLSMKYKF